MDGFSLSLCRRAGSHKKRMGFEKAFTAPAFCAAGAAMLGRAAKRRNPKKGRWLFMQKQVILTSDGLEKLEQELEQLKIVKRKEISDQLKVAISFGDLSENSEYDEAKNAQAMNEARILELEAMLKNAKVLDAGEINTDMVHVGSRVRVRDTEFDEEETYQIVGSTEVDPNAGKISDESPIGKALLGGKVGDIVEFTVPSGATITYEILEIMM